MNKKKKWKKKGRDFDKKFNELLIKVGKK